MGISANTGALSPPPPSPPFARTPAEETHPTQFFGVKRIFPSSLAIPKLPPSSILSIQVSPKGVLNSQKNCVPLSHFPITVGFETPCSERQTKNWMQGTLFSFKNSLLQPSSFNDRSAYNFPTSTVAKKMQVKILARCLISYLQTTAGTL